MSWRSSKSTPEFSNSDQLVIRFVKGEWQLADSRSFIRYSLKLVRVGPGTLTLVNSDKHFTLVVTSSIAVDNAYHGQDMSRKFMLKVAYGGSCAVTAAYYAGCEVAGLPSVVLNTCLAMCAAGESEHCRDICYQPCAAGLISLGGTAAACAASLGIAGLLNPQIGLFRYAWVHGMIDTSECLSIMCCGAGEGG